MAGELKITANTAQAQQAIQRLQTQVQALQSTFAGLGAVVTTVFSAALISRAIQFADTMSDISTATGISIERITGLTTAFIENGGSAESAQKAILNLAKSIDEAAAGSGKTQVAFERVGVSLQDLARLSEQDVLTKTIQGLSRITDASQRLSLAQQLLGKESRLVDFAGVAGSYDAASTAASRYKTSIEEAARLQGQLDRAFVTLQSSILKAIEPLARFINNLKPEQIDRFVEAVVKIGGAAGAIAVLATALSGLSKVFAALALVGTAAFAKFALGAQGISKTIEIVGNNIERFGRGARGQFDPTKFGLGERFINLLKLLGNQFVYLGRHLLNLLPGIGLVSAALLAMNEIVKAVFNIDPIDSFLKGLRGIGQALGLIKPIDTGDVDGSFARVEAARNRNTELAAREAARQREIQTAVDALRQRLTDVTSEYKRGGQALVDNLNFETSLVGKTEEEVAVARAVREERERSRQALMDLNRQQTELNQKLKSGSITQEEYQQSTAAIRSAAGQITAESQRQESSIARATQALQDRLRAQQLEKMQIQAILDLQEQQLQNRIDVAAYEDQVNAAIVQSAEQVRNLQRQLDLENQRAALEQSVRFLRKEDQDSARAIFDLETRRRDALLEIARIQNLPYEEQLRREREVNEAVDKSIGSIKTRAEAMRQEQESFATGWAQAMEQFRNNVQTQSELAGDIFSKLTKGMEDAFVNFAKTGKLSFKDLMRSIVEMILRSQIQRLIAQLFGAGPTGGNLFTTFLTSLFGGARAQGGPVSNNRAYLVGERGPELFMPRSNGEIIPNAQLGGGATQVTYNINAVDAESFRSLVARDPEFIFAVTEQGRRRMPTPRR